MAALPAAARVLPAGLIGVVVPGITWYTDGRGEVRALPARTVVPAAAALAPLAAGGRYAFLVLPEGDLEVEGRALPYEPTPIADVFPLGRADLPWKPVQRQGNLDLSSDWRLLFRERDAFEPWAPPGPAAAAVWAAYRRGRRPEPTFRTGPDRRALRFIYPQLVPPHLCHRLGPEYLRLPDRRPYATVCAECSEFGLRGGGGVAATVGNDALGWRVALRPAHGDPETARDPDAAMHLLSVHSPFWDLSVPSGGPRLLSATGGLLRG